MQKIIRDVAIYARVSKKDRQEVDNQLEQLREYCRRNGWVVIEEYIDKVSGKGSDDRAQFVKLFRDAYQRKFELVFFWSLDRFSREGVLETLQHLQKLTSYGVEWKSYTEQYLDSCGIFKDAVLAILATIAKQERIRIVERTVAGLERAKSKGKILGRKKIYCDIVTMLMMKRNGKSVREIAKFLGINKNTVTRRLEEHVKANPQLSKEIKEEYLEEIIIETFQENN